LEYIVESKILRMQYLKTKFFLALQVKAIIKKYRS
jgi:hypothetical protein